MPYTHVMVDSLAADAALIQIAAAAFDPVTGEIGPTFNVFIRDSRGERDALIRLAAFISAVAPTGVIEALWCHGGRDFVWLGSAYVRRGFVNGPPWSYKIERDTRTLYALAPGGMPEIPEDPARNHDARYDVERQIKSCVGALAALRSVRAPSTHEDQPVAGGYRGTIPNRTVADYYAIVAEPPPVWSRAEGYTEAYANPSPRPDDDQETQWRNGNH